MSSLFICHNCGAANELVALRAEQARPESVPTSDPLERFIRSVEFGEHWIWLKRIDRHGYGKFQVARRDNVAHRWAYEFFVGPIPSGLDLDHLCRERRCVRPEHLEPVTREENQRRKWKVR